MSRQLLCETKYFQFEKKNRSCQIRTQDLRRPRRIHQFQRKGAGDTQKK